MDGRTTFVPRTKNKKSLQTNESTDLDLTVLALESPPDGLLSVSDGPYASVDILNQSNVSFLDSGEHNASSTDSHELKAPFSISHEPSALSSDFHEHVELSIDLHEPNASLFSVSHDAKLLPPVSDEPRLSYARDEFLKNHDFVPIAEICEFKQVKILILLGTIKAVLKDDGWYYLACKTCNRKIIPSYFEDRQVLECNSEKCQSLEVTTVPRFRIKIRVQDISGVVSLTLFDGEAAELLQKSVTDFLKSNEQVDDMEMESYPEGIDMLLETRMAFKIEVADYNLTNKYYVYRVMAISRDEYIINELEKRFNMGQPIEDESININMSEFTSHDNDLVKDAYSATDDISTPVSQMNNVSASVALTTEKTKSVTSKQPDLKRKLVQVYDLEDSSNITATKLQEDFTQASAVAGKGVKLLTPKIEK